MGQSTLGAEDPAGSRHAIAQAVLAEAPPLPDPAPGLARSVQGEVLHASRSRPVVRWTVTDRGAGHVESFSLVGKVYGAGGGAAAHDLLTRLATANFGGPYDLARSLGYVPNRSLLLQTVAPPDTLHSLLTDPLAGRAAIRRTGGWLARLHAVPESGLVPLAADFEAGKAAEYVAGIATARPELGAEVHRLRRRMLPMLAAAERGRLVPTHGDLQPKNVHRDADRVVVIDFDRAALAPPARDLGHFVGQSLTMAAAFGQAFNGPIASWEKELTEGYLAEGGSPEALAGVPAYVARTFLEVLYYRLVVRPMKDVSFAQAWLAVARDWVERTPAAAA